MIDRLTGDLVKDLAWVLNWHGLDAATDRSATDLASYLLSAIDRLRKPDAVGFQAAVEEAAANPGKPVHVDGGYIVSEHGPEITRSER